jgi:hypothetical protein
MNVIPVHGTASAPVDQLGMPIGHVSRLTRLLWIIRSRRAGSTAPARRRQLQDRQFDAHEGRRHEDRLLQELRDRRERSISEKA